LARAIASDSRFACRLAVARWHQLDSELELIRIEEAGTDGLVDEGNVVWTAGRKFARTRS